MPKKKADMSLIGMGALGSVPHMLVNAGFDPVLMKQQLIAKNATVLRDDEWKEYDQAVVDIMRTRLVIVNDLVSRGLVYNVPNGLGKTVLEYEDMSDMSDAQISMAAEAEDQQDRVEFVQKYLPLPITHHGFSLNARALAASRTTGMPLDTTLATTAAIKVAEKIEATFATGASTYTYGGGTLYGLLDFTYKQSYTVAAHWNDSGADPLADVRGMKQYSINHKHYGPWMLYVPTAWETALDDNFTTNYPITVRERLRQVGGIIDVKVCDALTADYCVLVEFRPETIRAVIGLQPTTIEWESKGGLVSHYKVMAIIVPQIRADQDNNSGVIVGTA